MPTPNVDLVWPPVFHKVALQGVSGVIDRAVIKILAKGDNKDGN